MLCGVVGHRDREDMGQKLVRDIGGGVISLDDGSVGCERNHMEVLAWMLARAADADRLRAEWEADDNAWKPDPVDSTWFVVCEDDAQPVPDFPKHAEAALSHAPSDLVGFYMGTGNPSGQVQRALIPAMNAARATGKSWLRADWFISSVAYAIRRTRVADLLDFCDGRGEEWPLRVTRWAQDRVIDTSYTFPSMFNHADVPSVISPTRVARQPRRAHSWGIAAKWNTRTVRILGDNCPPWSVP